MERMTGTPADLRALVEQCLDNQPSRRLPISDVSERIKRMKDVESVRCPHVNMNPITWQQVEQIAERLREATITVPAANVHAGKVTVICISLIMTMILISVATCV